jgi:hypothetical protein
MSACPSVTPACQSIARVQNGEAVTCLLSSSTCGVNLDLLVQTLSSQNYPVTTTTPMWIGAWGGGGGHSKGGGSGSAGGYAQTTTSVADLIAKFGSSTVYYFIGQDGISSPESCGAAGGSATIVTGEDLSVNPSQNPTGADVLLIAGASGGGSGDVSGCGDDPVNGGRGASRSHARARTSWAPAPALVAVTKVVPMETAAWDVNPTSSTLPILQMARAGMAASARSGATATVAFMPSPRRPSS